MSNLQFGTIECNCGKWELPQQKIVWLHTSAMVAETVCKGIEWRESKTVYLHSKAKTLTTPLLYSYQHNCPKRKRLSELLQTSQ